MPCLLTTPISGGDLAANITHIRINDQRHRAARKSFQLRLAYGVYDSGTDTWTDAEIYPTDEATYPHEVNASQADTGDQAGWYDAIVALTVPAGETIVYAAAKTRLYEWLGSTFPALVGTEE